MTEVLQELSTHQQAQEVEYVVPYHWFWTPDSESGRSYFAYLALVAERIPTTAQTVCDVGCGDGRATSFLKDAHPTCSVTGVDYSARALELARCLSAPREIAWKEMNVYEGSAVLDGSFDCVTTIEMLEHIPVDQLDSALRNIRRLLAKDGTLVLTVPSTLAHQPVKHYQHFTQATISAALQRAGFSVERVDGQERSDHWLFSFYRFADNRWWTLKPLMRWFNRSVYPQQTSPCPPDKGNRLIVVARAGEGSSHLISYKE